jgi:carbon-monoxide dehydrogenase large subunit
VKWAEDRYEHLAASGHSKEVACELEIATDADGRFLALTGRFVGDGGAHQGHPWSSLIDPLCAASMLPGIYAVDAVRYEVDAAATNKCPTTAYRGVGWTSGQAAREALIDDAARALGIDPLELRLRNCLPDGQPAVSATGCRYDGGSYAESIRRARELAGYEAFLERQRRLRAEGRYVGIGFSPFVEQGGWAAQIAAAQGFPGAGYLDSVSVTVEPDGSVTLATGLQSNGQGPRDGARTAGGRRTGRAAGGRARRSGRHGHDGVLDRQLGEPDGADRGRLGSTGDGRRAAEAAANRGAGAGGQRG